MDIEDGMIEQRDLPSTARSIRNRVEVDAPQVTGRTAYESRAASRRC